LNVTYTLASFSVRSSINMQISPPPLTHTRSEIHSMTITSWPDWLQGSVWRQKHFKSCFWDFLWFTAVL